MLQLLTSRGRVRLTGPGPLDPADIESNFLSDPDDLKALVAVVELCREIGNSSASYVQSGREPLQHELRPLVQKTIGPWNLRVYFALPQLTESDSE
jgi:choline dehydrogenase-like flavoprotein